eukprot:CAMPEP_0177795218 /NCGR_PEP_ID=MMETSP0491_2-20121128/26108_1 /TAXON_ID=63592 /ORGANISM="Tetraselmis chuii, Strain PLY429" /LENGTH=394 /DNA_ID=CAMNT_0019318019 /DNA_START=482 /DNA_END=1666 /DNA_ORIENTATION=-
MHYASGNEHLRKAHSPDTDVCGLPKKRGGGSRNHRSSRESPTARNAEIQLTDDHHADGRKRARHEAGASPSCAPDRFYCPHPNCKRSFQDLWRLRVHHRADPDARGSGKERGHGVELPFCPKCRAPITPGKKHMVCKPPAMDLEDDRGGELQVSRESSDTRSRRDTVVLAAVPPSSALFGRADSDPRISQHSYHPSSTLLEELAARHHGRRPSSPLSNQQIPGGLMSNRQSPPEDSLMLLARRAAIHQRAAEQQAHQAEVQARAISSVSATDYGFASRYAAAAGLWRGASGPFGGAASGQHRGFFPSPFASYPSSHHQQAPFSPHRYQNMMMQAQQSLAPPPLPRGSAHSDEDALPAFQAQQELYGSTSGARLLSSYHQQQQQQQQQQRRHRDY